MSSYKTAAINFQISASSSDIRTNATFFSQDYGLGKFKFKLTNNTLPLDLTGATAILTIVTADKSTFQYTCDIGEDPTQGIAEIVLDKDVLQHIGTATAELTIVFSDSQSLSAGQFKFVIAQSLSDQSSGAIQYYIQSIENLKVQYQQEWESWFNTIKGQLGSDPAGNLQNQINDVTAQLADNTNKIGILSSDADKQIKNYIFNQSKLTRFWADIANADERLVHVVCIGDSITQGGASTDNNYNSWVGQLRQYLQMKLGAASNGFASVWSDASAYPTGWTKLIEGTNLCVAQGLAGSANLYMGFVGTEVDVLYTTKPDGGDLEIIVDNVSKGVVSCAGSLSYHNKATITGITYGGHDIQFKPVGNVYVEGIVYRSNTVGIQVHRVGHSGICASDYLNKTDAINASINKFAPSLTIIALGFNDYNYQRSLSDYALAMQQLIDNAKLTGSVAIMMYCPDDTSKTIPYEEYYKIAKSKAEENECVFIDIYNKWNKSPQWAVDNQLLNATNNVHPNNNGHKNIADSVIEALNVKENLNVALFSYYKHVLGINAEDKIQLKNKTEVLGQIVGSDLIYSSKDMGVFTGRWQHRFKPDGDAVTERNYQVKGNMYANQNIGTYDSENLSWLAYFDNQGTVNLLPRTTAPNVWRGRIYYDANDNTLKYYNGSVWKTIATL